MIGGSYGGILLKWLGAGMVARDCFVGAAQVSRPADRDHLTKLFRILAARADARCVEGRHEGCCGEGLRGSQNWSILEHPVFLLRRAK